MWYTPHTGSQLTYIWSKYLHRCPLGLFCCRVFIYMLQELTGWKKWDVAGCHHVWLVWPLVGLQVAEGVKSSLPHTSHWKTQPLHQGVQPSRDVWMGSAKELHLGQYLVGLWWRSAERWLGAEEVWVSKEGVGQQSKQIWDFANY